MMFLIPKWLWQHFPILASLSFGKIRAMISIILTSIFLHHTLRIAPQGILGKKIINLASLLV